MAVTQRALYRYLLTIFLAFLSLGFFAHAMAASMPDAFIIDINPSNFQPNEAVDMTIKAVSSNGQVVTDYDWDVVIDVKGIMDDDVIVPDGGIYFFVPQDQWVKTFSKWLQIKKDGEYIVEVYDIVDDSVKGEKTVFVGNAQSAWSETVTIITPVPGGVETNPAITVLAKASSLPNTPYQILVNGQVASQWTTNNLWDINAVVTGFVNGQNNVQIKVLDGAWSILGQSDIISLSYQDATDDVYKWIEVSPSNQLRQWDKAVFVVRTSDAVSSAELQFDNGKNYPMDRLQAWQYTKEVLMEDKWTRKVSLVLIAGGNRRLYSNISTLEIAENIAIGQTRFYSDAVDKTSLTLTWQVLWNSSSFKVMYGTGKDLLDQSVTVDKNEIVVNNINPLQKYYFQIYPLDAQGSVIGTPSSIIEVDPRTLLSCVVQGIALRTEQVGNKYYLVWDPVQYAQSYTIYRSDQQGALISDMQKVGSTTETRFEYPFNSLAKRNEYAYFAVQAVCANGTEILIDSIKQVEVWPFDSIVFVVCLTLLLYSVWSLYKRSI